MCGKKMMHFGGLILIVSTSWTVISLNIKPISNNYLQIHLKILPRKQKFWFIKIK